VTHVRPLHSPPSKHISVLFILICCLWCAFPWQWSKRLARSVGLREEDQDEVGVEEDELRRREEERVRAMVRENREREARERKVLHTYFIHKNNSNN